VRFGGPAGIEEWMNNDSELLRQFADEDSQEAFAELVQRTVNFVYAAALRQTGGDAHLAQDVTQGVYRALACQASTLKRHAVLTGWLYTTTRFLATKAVRTQRRWQRREQEAHTMNAILRESEPGWEQLRPLIDEAMHELGENDRTAILLRYFDGHSFTDVGASLGLAESAARMRVERALEKLRERLEKRGITSTAAAIGAVLAHQPAISAPAGLAAAAARAALAGAAVGGGGVGAAFLTFKSMSTTTLTLGTIGAIAAFGIGTWFGMRQGADTALAPAVDTQRLAQAMAALRAENRQLRGAVEQLNSDNVALRAAHAAQAASSANANPPLSIAEQQRRAILNNLRQIVAARDQFLLEYGRAPTTLAELVGPEPEKMIRWLNAVDGEDYGQLKFADGETLLVMTSNGVAMTLDLGTSGYPIPGAAGTFSVPPPLPPLGLRRIVEEAIDSYRVAHSGKNPPMNEPNQLVPYFQSLKDGADYLEWLEARKAVSR
jgi:RNA polymerase sigma factor (sigma-70 family)